MQLNKLYKNRYTLDVAFRPIYLIDESETSLTFKGEWYNINTSTPFTIGQDIIKVDKSQLDNWSELESI